MATGTSEGRDIIEHLTSEHRQVEQMWAELEQAHASGAPNQQDIGQEIVRALSQHDALELQLLYPALSRTGQSELADGAKDEHAEIRRLLNEVDGKDPADDGVYATFVEMRSEVDRHVAQEEQVLFPLLRGGLTSDELIDLGETSEKAEKLAPTHPTTPDGRAGATVAGAAAGLVDRARDALERR